MHGGRRVLQRREVNFLFHMLSNVILLIFKCILASATLFSALSTIPNMSPDSQS